MNFEDLDALIEELRFITPGPPRLIGSLEVHDWGLVFAKAREIQAAFKSGVRYPTKIERDAAWARFNELRTTAFKNRDLEQEHFRYRSKGIRDEILNSISSVGYNELWDWFTHPFGLDLKSKADSIKNDGELLKQAGRILSQNKGIMLKEHKAECFERIQEARAELDRFWEAYRKYREDQREEFRRKRYEIIDRLKANIRRNQENLDKARTALDRVEENIEKNEERLSSAKNEDFAERVRGWLDEDREKLQSISETIERYENWIREEEERLDDLRGRLENS